MNNFEFHNPTRLVFGRGTIAQLGTLVPKAKVMLTFGGGSVKHNGVYEQVIEALKGYDITEFWGIEPNPKVETLRRAVEICKQKGIEFILAVGGGSVLDGTKLIAIASKSEMDAWELVIHSESMNDFVPFGSVMTMPATGSEMNANAVISRLETEEKLAFNFAYPCFSILDPEVTYSIPKYQVACGLADTFVHTMEQYMTVTGCSPLMDRWSEGILLTLRETASKIFANGSFNHTDYDTMSDYMLCATMGLNEFIAMGVPQDWATHGIGHELTALKGITHGHTLAIVLPALLWVMRRQKWGKLLQYGRRVWGITEGSEEERVERAIAMTEEWFQSLGLATRLSEFDIDNALIAQIEERFNRRGTRLGEQGNIDGSITREILERAL